MFILTTFCPKKSPLNEVIQLNAMENWPKAFPEVPVVSAGGVPDWLHVSRPIIEHQFKDGALNKYGMPYVPDLLEMARNDEQCASMYCNADILWGTRMGPVFDALLSLEGPWLAVGRRRDAWVTSRLQNGCLEPEHVAKIEGNIANEYGLDYFIWKGWEPWVGLPRFHMARTCWDDAIPAHAQKHGVKVIDLSPAVNCLHQRHDYNRGDASKGAVPGHEWVWKGPEAKENYDLYVKNFCLHTNGVNFWGTSMADKRMVNNDGKLEIV